MEPEVKKILVGDDHIGAAKAMFPCIPGVTVDFVDTSDKLVEKAFAEDYTMIITDLNEYRPSKPDGFAVLDIIKDVDVRKVLWTSSAYSGNVRDEAKRIGVELLDKPEIDTVVGMICSDAPIKQEGEILVYSRHGPLEYVMAVVSEIIRCSPRPFIKVSSELEKELLTGWYKTVIDTTVLGPISEAEVATHIMQGIKLEEVPILVPLTGTGYKIVNIASFIADYGAK
ncbi:MAG: hypothetical protein ABH828_02275 [archaeon]